MLVAAAYVDATITCAAVLNLLTPCINYVIFGGTVPPACCEGIKALDAASSTTKDHRAACSCIMDDISRIPGINYEVVGTLLRHVALLVPTKSHPLLIVPSKSLMLACLSFSI